MSFFGLLTSGQLPFQFIRRIRNHGALVVGEVAAAALTAEVHPRGRPGRDAFLRRANPLDWL